MSENRQRLLLLGATGAVGQQVLSQALADRRIAQVVAPTRRALPAHERLINPVVDFAALTGDEPWLKVDNVICALGTTIKVAGSQAAFAAIDRDLVAFFANAAKNAGAGAFGLNSSLGASASGTFYLRTKYEAEELVRDAGFASLTIVRPSLIDAPRGGSRPLERIGAYAMRLLNPIIPKRYRSVTPQAVAHILLGAALAAEPGERIIESEGI